VAEAKRTLSLWRKLLEQLSLFCNGPIFCECLLAIGASKFGAHTDALCGRIWLYVCPSLINIMLSTVAKLLCLALIMSLAHGWLLNTNIKGKTTSINRHKLSSLIIHCDRVPDAREVGKKSKLTQAEGAPIQTNTANEGIRSQVIKDYRYRQRNCH
jgi:hypothetical protein